MHRQNHHLSGRRRLLLLRHGATVAGSHVFLDARHDPPLSPLGVRQARALHQRLRAAEVAAVVVSPMGRARETAELAVSWMTPRIDDRVREVDHGVFNGLAVSEVETRYPAELAAWRSGVSAPPGGEPLPSLIARSLAAALDAAAALPDHGDVLFVTHSGPIRALLTSARGYPMTVWQRARVPHGSLRSITITPAVLARWQALVPAAPAGLQVVPERHC